jgi:hypothetical protein
MKSLILPVFLLSAVTVLAQPEGGNAAAGDPIASVQSGLWTAPATWDCACIPSTGNEVSVQFGHEIELLAGDTARAEGLAIAAGAALLLPTDARVELTASLASLGTIEGRGVMAFIAEGDKVCGPATLEHLACGHTAVTLVDTVAVTSQLDVEGATLQTDGKLVLVDLAGMTAGAGEVQGSLTRSFDYVKTTSFTHLIGPGVSGSDAASFLEVPGAVYAKHWIESETAYQNLYEGDLLDPSAGMTCSLPQGIHHFEVLGEAVFEATMPLTSNSTYLPWKGWNMMANPLSGFLDITSANQSIPGSLGATYQWVDSLKTYVAQVDGLGLFGHVGLFEPGAAFWTVVDTSFEAHFDVNALVTKSAFERGYRYHQHDPLALEITDEINVEQCVVAIGAGDDNYHRAEDAPFLMSGRNNMDLYSQSADGVNLMVNRTSGEEGLSIPILAKALSGTELTITVTRIPDNVCLTLEDIETGWSAPLTSSLSYTFTTLSSNADHRFNLIVGGGVEAVAMDAACESAANGTISVVGPDVASTFVLHDADGNAAGTFASDSLGGTFSGLAMGVYTVTAMSDGCADLSRTVEVGAGGSGIAPFSVDAMPDHIGCYDDHGGVTLDIEGGLEPYTVEWAHGAVGSTIEVESAGVLDAVITDAAGCSDSTSVEVLAAPQVQASMATELAVVALIDGEAEVYFENTSSGATAYQWHFGDGASSTADNPIHAYTAVGAYTVGLNAWNDYCSDTYQMVVTVETVSSIGSTAGLGEATIQRLSAGWEVQHPDEDFTVEVFDLTGRVIYQATGQPGSPALIDPSMMPAVSLVHWRGHKSGRQKTWRVAR